MHSTVAVNLEFKANGPACVSEDCAAQLWTKNFGKFANRRCARGRKKNRSRTSLVEMDVLLRAKASASRMRQTFAISLRRNASTRCTDNSSGNTATTSE